MLILKLLTTVVLAYVIIVLTLVIFQRQFLYHPTKHILSTPPAPFKVTTVETIDGLSLTGWYAPAQPNKPTLLIFHGNGATIEWRLPKIQRFLERGYGVYLAEYRGYGGNPGKPTEPGLKQGALAHYQYLADQDVKTIVTYGESLGTHLALYIGTEKPISGVILENAYTTIPAIAKKHYPIAAFATRFVRDQYNSLALAPNINVPVLQLHAENDTTVPIAYGKQLHRRFKAPAIFFVATGIGHNNIYDNPETAQTVFQFLETLVTE